MGESINDHSDNPTPHTGDGTDQQRTASRRQLRGEGKTSLGKAAFLVFCLAATAFIVLQLVR